MPDNLDQQSDAELNTIFAVEVAALIFKPRASCVPCGVDHEHWESADGVRFDSEEVQFSTDANAVLPWLDKDKERAMDIRRVGDGWGVSLRPKSTPTAEWQAACAPTFARAATIALIRAKRATQSPAPTAK